MLCELIYFDLSACGCGRAQRFFDEQFAHMCSWRWLWRIGKNCTVVLAPLSLRVFRLYSKHSSSLSCYRAACWRLRWITLIAVGQHKKLMTTPNVYRNCSATTVFRVCEKRSWETRTKIAILRAISHKFISLVQSFVVVFAIIFFFTSVFFCRYARNCNMSSVSVWYVCVCGCVRPQKRKLHIWFSP